MNDAPPPILSPSARAGLKLARCAAWSSIGLPALALLMVPAVIALFVFAKLVTMATVQIFVALAILMVVAGLGLSILALALPKRDERKGIWGKALTGLIANVVLLAVMVALPFAIAFFTLRRAPLTPLAKLGQASNELAGAQTEVNRFYALDAAAKESFNSGNIEEARSYANELLTLAPKYRGDWNYGNAIQDGNLVLGRIAVREGKLDEARQRLIAAGNGPGSPQMNSFGPNMSLAKDLIEKGDRDTPVQYFDLCRKFWSMDNGNLTEWTQEVKAGKTPDFGANLDY